MVKETHPSRPTALRCGRSGVSIPSRGSGKGDLITFIDLEDHREVFQSPLGEVVKETLNQMQQLLGEAEFQSPLGEVVKETQLEVIKLPQSACFNPLSGKW